MEVVEQKREIRKLVGEWGSQFPDNLKREQETKLYALLERVPQFFEAKKIAFYWSLKSEFFTHDFINKWADKKDIYIPKVQGDELVFCKYTGENLLAKGTIRDLFEPTGEVYTGDFDLIIVPGIAFTERGDRLGRGGGYYDRFLGRTKAYKLALLYDFQLITELPIEEHDVRVDFVLAYKG